MFETDTPYAFFRAESTKPLNNLIFHMLMCCVYDCVLSLYIYDVENYYSIQLILITLFNTHFSLKRQTPQ